MSDPAETRDLVLDRLLDAPRDKVWRCWTEVELMKLWFVPKPWTLAHAEIDLRPGGSSLVVMADPDGNEFPNRGVYLEIVPNERLAFTDAFTSAWEPSGKAFFACTLTFADEGAKTRYVATARHWSVEDRRAHEAMGFHDGWGRCADQLEALAKTL